MIRIYLHSLHVLGYCLLISLRHFTVGVLLHFGRVTSAICGRGCAGGACGLWSATAAAEGSQMPAGTIAAPPRVTASGQGRGAHCMTWARRCLLQPVQLVNILKHAQVLVGGLDNQCGMSSFALDLSLRLGSAIVYCS